MIKGNGELSFNTIICSGAIVCARATKRVLLLQKSNGKHNGTWGLVGGTNLQGETAWQGLQREIEEELSFVPTIAKIIPLEKFVSNDSLFNFSTYFCIVENEFLPVLSNEHLGWGWFDLNYFPKPTHKALDLCLKNKIIQSKITNIIDLLEIM
jgi:8-oxo-dGTP pyrophosphatase MutT (NUDIX family)